MINNYDKVRMASANCQVCGELNQETYDLIKKKGEAYQPFKKIEKKMPEKEEIQETQIKPQEKEEKDKP